MERTAQNSKSILDTRVFAECRQDQNLLKNCIAAYLIEEGFPEDEIPPEAILRGLYCTFAATVAIRAELPPNTPMRRVVQAWDEVMMSYSLTRSLRESQNQRVKLIQ